MAQLKNPALSQLPLIKNHKPTNLSSIPVINLSLPDCKTELLKACEQFGFFKVINHGVPIELMARLQSETENFFSLPLSEKEKAGPANPFGYGNRRIGPNGDVGWIEYLLLKVHPKLNSQGCNHAPQANPCKFCEAENHYISAVRNLACRLLELIAEALNVQPRNAFSKFLKDKESDSVFRLNHYPPCPDSALKCSIIGFGEHTDPQILTVLKSNNIAGLEMCSRDGNWISLPPDPNSFYIKVGDCLQVLTNGRFWSVRHRVVTNSNKSRLSMIFFGAPPLKAKVAPLPLFIRGGKTNYKEFTWYEYKKAAYASRLGDNRLDPFRAEEKETWEKVTLCLRA